MSDESILARVGAHVRAEQAEDRELEAHARGDASATLSPALAAAAAPLGLEVEERIAAKLALATRAAEPRSTSEIDRAAETKPAARVITFPRALAVLAPLAVAAAIALGVGRSPKGEALPAYVVSVTGEATMRGAATEPSTRLRIGSGQARFEIVARPERAVSARTHVTAHAFLMRDGVVLPVRADEVSVEVSDDGSVRITGPSSALAGANELRLVLGSLDAAKALGPARAGAGTDGGVSVLTIAIDR